MASHIIYKLFNMSVLSLVISIVYCRPIHTRCNTRPHETIAKCTPCTDRCPGSPEIKASLLEKFKQFDNCVTNETVLIRIGGLGLSAIDDQVKFTPPSGGNINCNDQDITFFFYKYQFTINGTKMMSLVPVGSHDLIVTWGPVDVGSGDINDTIITYELKTENITKVFDMISNTTDYDTNSSNRTDYDTNWLFQMDYSESLFHVKILTKEGDLAVTYYKKETTLTKKITGVSEGPITPVHQSFAVCNNCPDETTSL